MRRVFCLLPLASFTLTALAGVNPCPSGLYAGSWVYPSCNDPQIVVSGDVVSVTFGGEIEIVATAGSPGISNVSIRAITPTSLGKIVVSSVAAATVHLTVGANIVDLASGIEMDETSAITGLFIAGGISGDLGSVVASRIGYTSTAIGFGVGDDLVGNLLLKDNSSDIEIRVDGLSVGGDIGPNVHIDTEAGGIGGITVGGVIGTAGNPVLIHSGRDITSITAGEMHVNIVAGWDDPSNPNDPIEWANIEELRTDKLAGQGGHTGNFIGSIYANTIGEPVKRPGDPEGAQSIPQIEVQGDFQGILGFESPIVPHHTFTGSQIVVGGAFKSGSVISLPASGLEGQIIFNQANIGSPWQSNARIEVGSVDLTTTQYNPSASTIGGGAAGLAEFRLHRESCSPPEALIGNPPIREPGLLSVPSELVMSSDGLSWDCVPQKPSVVLQFYGPVSIAALPAATIHRWQSGAWVLQEATAFAFAESVDGDNKRVSLTPVNDWVGGSYRVTRKPNALNSLEVANSSSTDPAGVNAFTYYFDVEIMPCEGALVSGFDLNSDEAVTEPGDVPAWLITPEDFNADATTDATDMQLLQSAAALYGATPEAPDYFPGPYVDVE